MSTAYSHVWRAADTDFPCNLTGREGPGSNGQIYVEIAREDNLTYVPQEQLVTFENWKAEQSKSAGKPPHRPASLSLRPPLDRRSLQQKAGRWTSPTLQPNM